MGIGVVLIFYFIFLTAVASLGAVGLGTLTYFLVRRSGRWRRAVLAAVLFPFLCETFAGGWFLAYAFINYEVFKRDPMLGDTWQTPLPNGYALLMIDTTDQGTVYNPETQPGNGSVVSRDDAVFGVRQLQVSKELIFGARDSGYFNRIGQESKSVDAYFELDTTHRTHTEFSSLNQLQQEAASKGIRLQLREFQSVLREFRYTWFDYCAIILLLLPPTAGFLTLATRIWRIRQRLSRARSPDHQLG